ncbi:two-component system nitrogen regulation sensor histidine kinase NtrY [Catalinimonas alkaloidigena]|uniref:sensor histidine kinase n=1 Tax=Catalinimonas alkaloidigena TaxID=1075417 RepID=UPI002405D2F0|nr:ATP-binding protein [Catalinimonas alkaloidigena]MDF9799893.1 two-component system nitrogen regulation sensor histidine kinase NtrY [Catalinimonas alkaloidigena]
MKSFALNTSIRVALLLITMIGFAFILGRADLLFNHIILGALLIIQVYELIRYVNLTNRELAKLLLSIRNSDFTISFSSQKGGRQFRELNDAFKEIIEAYKQVKIEKEAQFEYLKLIVKHIKIGIISIRGDEEIALINQPALDMLQTGRYHYWRNLMLSHPRFVEEVEQLRENESKLIEIPVKGENKRLSVHVSSAILLKQPYKIITFQDIEKEINQSEIDAWHKLIRILTHEIMNSVTPISSLTETMLMLLENPEGQLKTPGQVDESLLEDLAFSLRTIQKRSDGLMGFVEDYRKLARIPQPQKEIFQVKELFETIHRLMRAELQKQGVQLDTSVFPANLHLSADRKQVEQILINLLSNSIQALEHAKNPEVSLKAYEELTQIIVEVTDNGFGIEEDKLDQIFVPFFSTKEKGSGIGLSLSRNIMNMHGGTIKASSNRNEQTTFSLFFPKTSEIIPATSDN